MTWLVILCVVLGLVVGSRIQRLFEDWLDR